LLRVVWLPILHAAYVASSASDAAGEQAQEQRPAGGCFAQLAALSYYVVFLVLYLRQLSGTADGVRGVGVLLNYVFCKLLMLHHHKPVMQQGSRRRFCSQRRQQVNAAFAQLAALPRIHVIVPETAVWKSRCCWGVAWLPILQAADVALSASDAAGEQVPLLYAKEAAGARAEAGRWVLFFLRSCAACKQHSPVCLRCLKL
jgi:hypothetical protein